MKTVYLVLSIVVLVSRGYAAGTISIDDFKKITNEDQRRLIIDQAPPNEKAELQAIDLHLGLLAGWGGDSGLRNHKETCIIKARGLIALEAVFGEYNNFWGGYASAMISADKRPGMKPEQQKKIVKKWVKEELLAVGNRIKDIHSLVYHLAPTPAALELCNRAGALADQLAKRDTWDGSAPYQPITTEERKGIDEKIDQILDELHRLPKLTPEQLQKEYDAFTDLDIVKWS
jgi:hypothetical protein